MKLPFFTKKQEPVEYYVALLLRDETTSVVALEEKNGILHVAAQHTDILTTPLEEIETEQLLDVLDKAITDIESQLPKNANLFKTVFGVKESWVEEAHIKKDYLAKLKTISEELELKPIGFLVFSEAIAHVLQEEEGAPVSAILVEIGKVATTIALLKGGKVIETHTSPNEHHVTKTIEALLAGMTSVEILPSKILLFSSEESSRIVHALLAHTWDKDLPFLHTPQVSTLPVGFDIKAVLFGTAAQLGFTADTHYKPTVQTSAHALLEDTQADEENMLNEKENEEAEKKEKSPLTGHVDLHTERQVSTDNFTAADFGFVVGQDIAQHPELTLQETTSKKENKYDTLDNAIEEVPENVREEVTGEKEGKESFARDGMFMVTGLKQTLKKLFAKKKKAYVPPEIKESEEQFVDKSKAKKKMNKFFILLPLLAILFVAGILFYIFKEKAVITLTVSAKTDSHDNTVTFIADQGNNFDNNQISGTTTTLTESDSLQGQATGSKSVGDKAKGTVTIYNSNDTQKTISAGTMITSSNSLKFTLDKDVTIASASGDVFSGTKPGTQDVTVTANDIGTDYNLPSGTTFSVPNIDNIAAKNANAFSGGTKKQVTIVSKDDQSKLLDTLTKNLQDKAKNDMNNQGGDKVLLPVFIDTKITKKSFDKNVGDQANTVTLTESVDFQGIAYAKQDVEDFANKVSKDSLSSNLQLADNGVTADVTDPKQKSDTEITATIKISIKEYPKLDTTQLLQTVKGYSFDKAENFLHNQPQVSDVEIKLSPNIPFLPKLLPRNESNISIVVKNQ